MKWFGEHKFITSLIAILLVLVVLFAASANTDGGRGSLGDAIAGGTAAISSGLSRIGNGIRNGVAGMFSHRKLQARIDELEQENEELKRSLSEARLSRTELDELTELSKVLDYNFSEEKLELVSGSVIARDGSSWTGEFTLDIGTEDGAEAGCTVIAGMGLVGRIETAERSWSRVICLTNDDLKVSFKVLRNPSIHGICYGDGKGGIAGYIMDPEDEILQGDVLVTSGIGNYEAGIEIGSVKRVIYNSNTLMTEITVEANCRFDSLARVSVVKK